jgi:hypothetical protein
MLSNESCVTVDAMESQADKDSGRLTSPRKLETPSPTKFLLPARLWSECQLLPFRFLDLPPELRNRVYEHAFTGSGGLSPHHLTQVNRQIRIESLQLYYTRTHTLQIPLQNPAHMARFLEWIESDSATFSLINMAYEFTYNDPDAGMRTIRFAQGACSPRDIYQGVKRLGPEYSDVDHILATWLRSLSVFQHRLFQDVGEIFFRHPPPSRFLDTINDGALWTVHVLEFVGESPPPFPAASSHAKEFFNFFLNLMVAMADKKWDKKCLRTIAWFLFTRSIRAELEA